MSTYFKEKKNIFSFSVIEYYENSIKMKEVQLSSLFTWAFLECIKQLKKRETLNLCQMSQRGLVL